MFQTDKSGKMIVVFQTDKSGKMIVVFQTDSSQDKEDDSSVSNG